MATLDEADRILAVDVGIEEPILKAIKEMGTVPIRIEGIDENFETVLVDGIPSRYTEKRRAGSLVIFVLNLPTRAT